MDDPRKYEKYRKKIKLFHDFSDNDISEVLKHGTTMRFRAGQPIYHEGQMSRTIFVVIEGRVNIESQGYIIAKCRAGDVFGEMSALNHRPHSASADAINAVKLFTLDSKQINKLLEKKIGIQLLLNIIHILTSHIDNANASHFASNSKRE